MKSKKNWVWVVEKPGAFLSGIFKTETEARAHCESIPAKLRRAFKVRKVAGRFPLYFLEKKAGVFNFIGTYRDAQHAAKRSKTPCLLFIVRRPWASDATGEDEMGVLEHRHFGEDGC